MARIRKVLRPYAAVVDFLADFLGKDAEIVLHDLADLEHSIVKIRNSHVSGRKTGDPATDWLIRTLRHREGGDSYCSYRGKSRDGKTLKCASLLLRDDDGEVAGVLCVNLEVDEQIRFHKYLEMFLQGVDERDRQVKENLGQSVDEMVDASLDRAIARHGLKPSALSQEDKTLVLEAINNDGVFQLKGAVAKVARRLRISEPTVYRYLSRIGKKE